MGKVVRSSIILAINTDINSPPVGMGEEANLEGCVYTTIFGRRGLFSIWDYLTTHGINEIISQVDVKMNTLVRTRVLSGLGAIEVYCPHPYPKHDRIVHPVKYVRFELLS